MFEQVAFGSQSWTKAGSVSLHSSTSSQSSSKIGLANKINEQFIVNVIETYQSVSITLVCCESISSLTITVICTLSIMTICEHPSHSWISSWITIFIANRWSCITFVDIPTESPIWDTTGTTGYIGVAGFTRTRKTRFCIEEFKNQLTILLDFGRKEVDDSSRSR